MKIKNYDFMKLLYKCTFALLIFFPKYLFQQEMLSHYPFVYLPFESLLHRKWQWRHFPNYFQFLFFYQLISGKKQRNMNVYAIKDCVCVFRLPSKNSHYNTNFSQKKVGRCGKTMHDLYKTFQLSKSCSFCVKLFSVNPLHHFQYCKIFQLNFFFFFCFVFFSANLFYAAADKMS